MNLTGTSDELQVVLGGAITTNELQFIVGFNDLTSSAISPDKNKGETNGTTPVALISSPAASHQRQLRYCSIYNSDTVNATVTVQFYDGSNTYVVFKVTIAPGLNIQYTFEKGWSGEGIEFPWALGLGLRIDDTASQIEAIGELNEQTDDYTLILDDYLKTILMNKGSANTLQIPNNSDVPFLIGTEIMIVNLGAGQTQIIGDTDVTILSADGADKLRVQYSSGVIKKVDTDDWLLVGDLSA